MKHDMYDTCTTGDVTALVHAPLHPPPQRVEQRRRGQRRGRHGDRAVEPEYAGGQQNQARVQPVQEPGDDR